MIVAISLEHIILYIVSTLCLRASRFDVKAAVLFFYLKEVDSDVISYMNVYEKI